MKNNYPEPKSHITDKAEVVLDLIILLKELEHATGDDTSDLAAEKYFIHLKAEVDKLDIINWCFNSFELF